ncbi:TonB-dependent receptor domain-containing protein [Cellulophaga sp. BC115SP]|uniref:TonB-dependent receptor n=1 Tax=Cellulophaga sp. BC115SP TaxID=2683263 RepID=UPI00141271A6|nr:TonB-dependent receptor [Cellulophaga sp. BC115SP]NBB29473.1 TonB-dependent receptor [Cellulophaga sp. BC115SP]
MQKLFTTLVGLLWLLSFGTIAQNFTLKGQIINQTTQLPIEGAIVRTTPNGYAITNSLGEFSISKLTSAEVQVQVSHIGYQKYEAKVKANQTLKIALPVAMVQLDEVEVHPENAHQQQTISSIDLQLRPINNSQEVLRSVPGLFIGQHAGGGKAEQIFLRGFDLDHGTDIRLTVDGMPVNMVSHAHGQGYADLHFVIPELIERVDFKKGPYYADKGNFTTAGWVDFRTRNVLDKNFVKVEAGQFNTYRAVGAFNLLGQKAKERNESMYVGGEYSYSDSYFDSPQHFRRVNAVTKYNRQFSSKSQLTLTASTFWSKWNHSGQIPDRAVDAGQISFYGAIDDTEGGETSRTNLNAQLVTQLGNGVLKNQLFYSNYNFLLFSNFTFFKEDPVKGDQIKQHENRNLWGGNTSYSLEHGNGASSNIGIDYRQDFVNNLELSRTVNRTFVSDSLKYGKVMEQNLGFYYDYTMRLSERLTANVGLRYDMFWNRYNNFLSDSSKYTLKANASILSPKFNLYYTPNNRLQLYLNTGKGFHSNDTRVVVATQGREILPAAYGSDLGVVWKPFSKLLLNMSAWYLWLDQEFVYVGDEAVVEPSGKTRRMGLDFSLRYQITDWLYADMDWNIAKPRALGVNELQAFLPLAPTRTSTGGLNVRTQNGWSGSLRYRYMADRPANDDNTIIAKGYFVNDMQVNYQYKAYNFGLSIQNLANVRWKETQFATESQLKNETEPVNEIHFTAGTPFFAKLSVGISF